MLAIPIEGNRWIMTLRLPLPLKSLLLFFYFCLKLLNGGKNKVILSVEGSPVR